MTKEEVFEAAKALQTEEEGCTFKGKDGLLTQLWWNGFRKRLTAKKIVESILDFRLICHLHSGTYC